MNISSDHCPSHFSLKTVLEHICQTCIPKLVVATVNNHGSVALQRRDTAFIRPCGDETYLVLSYYCKAAMECQSDKPCFLAKVWVKLA